MNITDCVGTALADTTISFDHSNELMTDSCGLTIYTFLGFITGRYIHLLHGEDILTPFHIVTCTKVDA